MSFGRLREQYVQSLSDPATEELISLAIYRPVGFVFASLLAYLPVTPNQVTILKIAVTLVGVVLLYREYFVLAGIVLFVSILLDHIDGQLARLKGLASAFGHALDDMSDYAMFILNYTAAAIVFARQMGHWLYFFVGFVGGVMSFFHTVIFDNATHDYRDTSVSDARDIEKELDGHRQSLRETRNPFRKMAYGIHVFHLKAQMASAGKDMKKTKNTPLFLRLCSLVGPMMHATILAVFVTIWRFDILMVVNLVVLNLFLLVLFLLRNRINRSQTDLRVGP